MTIKRTKRAAATKSRTDEFGAESRGQTLNYLPEALTLVTEKDHPLYDERVDLPVDSALVRSIMSRGVIEPIVIRRNGTDPKGFAIVEVIDGRQRVKACLQANVELAAVGKDPAMVPAVLRRTDDAGANEDMIATNEIRRADDVVTRAEKLQRYLQRVPDERRAKVAFGIKSREMEKLLAVLAFSQPLKDALRAGQITMIIARLIGAMPTQRQETALQQVLSAGGGKGRGEAAKQAAAKATGTKPQVPRMRTQAACLKALDNVACMPRDDYQKGVLDALEWFMGTKNAAWAAQEKKS